MSPARSGQSGQAVVIFAISIFVLLVMAAAAFDVGQSMLDRRHQQDASDAAALAGARYLLDDPDCPTSPSTANCPKALHAALQVAFDNGYGNGTANGANLNGATVTVSIPPTPTSQFSGLSGYIQVSIGSTRPSIFAGRFLPAAWRVAAMAVAKNGADVAAPYSFLALNKTACPSVLISGQGSVTAGGNIQINSSCPNGALQTTGQASIEVTSPTGEIDVVGDWSSGGTNVTVDPTPTEGAPWQPDPLADLPPPPLPGAPQPVVEVSGSKDIPAGCPGGSNPATAEAPATCQFTSSYSSTVWRLYPGYYPGGLKFQSGTFYLEPGIYYLGGGGLDANGGGATIYSVDAGGTAPPMGGGVLLYNTEDATFHTECATNPTYNTGCLGPIMLNGSSAPIQLQAIQDGDYAGIVIFEDRTLSIHDPTTGANTGGADVQINGSSSTLNVVGTIYVPRGLFQANGNAGTSSTVQVIADEFRVTGNNASITAAYNGDSFFKFRGVGLVE